MVSQQVSQYWIFESSILRPENLNPPLRVYPVFRFLSFVTFFLISVALDKIGSDLPPQMLHRGLERDPASWGGAYRVHTIDLLVWISHSCFSFPCIESRADTT
jgi:hypothetical protein